MIQKKSTTPLIEDAIDALSRLPGVGRKTAQRMVFHLLRRDHFTAKAIGEILPRLVDEVRHCQECRNFTAELICELCAHRQHTKDLCIVESPMDLMAIESSGAFKGRYFVLHGYLSPIDGIGPQELGLDLLENLLHQNLIEEVIIATNGSIDGETTSHFLRTQLQSHPVRVSRIAQGIPLGGELEYTDGATLAQALYHRQVMDEKV